MQTLEKRITREYKKAAKEVEEKLNDHLAKFAEKDKEKRTLLKQGKITRWQYNKWRVNQMATGKHWANMRDILAKDLSNANLIAADMINGHVADVFALNANYGAYRICKGTGLNLSFELYDHATVARLLKRNPEIIPKAKLNIPKDLRWNRQKLTSAVLQGILQGDSIPNIAKRLSSVANMNQRAAIRNARTYTTAAENGGRVDSYKRAQGMGISMLQEWTATVDMRTRDSHRRVDGERIPVGGTFSNGCRYPGDPQGRPEEIYNCRCTLTPYIVGMDTSNATRFTRLPAGMTYDEWKMGRKK